MILKEENKTYDIINAEDKVYSILSCLCRLHQTIEWYIDDLENDPQEANCYMREEDYNHVSYWLGQEGLIFVERPFILEEGQDYGIVDILVEKRQDIDDNSSNDIWVTSITNYKYRFSEDNKQTTMTVEFDKKIQDKNGNIYTSATIIETETKDTSSIVIDFH